MMIRKRGFTLIELLIVLLVFVIFTALATQTFLSTLRGTSKTQVTNAVKEEASYAMSIIQRALYPATGVTCQQGTRVNYYDQIGNQSYFSCEQIGDSGYIASGSANARLTSGEVGVTTCSVTCIQLGGNTAAVELDVTFKRSGSDLLRRPEEKAQVQLRNRVLLRN